MIARINRTWCGAAAVVVLLVTLLPATQAVAADASRAVVSLRSQAPDTSEEGAQHGLLLRELGRQAVLIAARDGLGLDTRDAALGEAIGDDDAALDIVTTCVPAESYRIKISRKDETIWVKRVTLAQSSKGARPIVDIPQIVAACEVLSRVDAVAGLKKGGFKARPVVATAPGAKQVVPAEIEALLDEPDMLPQFDAARRLNGLIRAGGDSPVLRGALIRAYANLGQQTRWLWYPAHKAYEARSLLYAQRMVIADPKSAAPLWHRAYAEAIVGLHAAALADLAQAAKLTGGDRPPAWVKLVDALCRYQTGKLTDLAVEQKEAGLAPTAMFFAFLTIEHAEAQGAEMTVLKGAYDMTPSSLRLLDAMNTRTGPGMKNWVVEQGPAQLSINLGKGLPKMDLPDGVLEKIRQSKRPGGNPQARAIIARAMIEQSAADRGEPSIGALGRMIQEATFVQIARKTSHIVNGWGVDATAYVESAAPLIADHPFKKLIEVYAALGAHDEESAADALRELKPMDVELNAIEMVALLNSRKIIPIPEEQRFWTALAAGHGDATAWEMEEFLILNKAWGVKMDPDGPIKQFKIISPFVPMIDVIRIRGDWDDVKDDVAKIEKEHGSHPSIALALGQRFMQERQWDDAERNLKRYVNVARDKAGYVALAGVYQAKGDDAKFLQTLNEFLKQPDYGLQHAQVQVMICDYLTSKGKVQDALPYAEAAAETRAEWAMQTAARTNQLLGKWDRAEQWVRESAFHYGHVEQWFEWCAATGHGNLKGAGAAFLEAMGDLTDEPANSARLRMAVWTYRMMGDQKRALRLLKRITPPGDPIKSIILAVVAGNTDIEARDAALKAVADNANGDADAAGVELAKWFSDNWPKAEADPKAKLDTAGLDRLIEAAERSKETTPAELRYLAGRFMDINGRETDALRYYKLAFDRSQPRDAHNRTLLLAELRKRNAEPIAKRPSPSEEDPAGPDEAPDDQ